jgi:Proteolipid membrane potential modulator
VQVFLATGFSMDLLLNILLTVLGRAMCDEECSTRLLWTI